MEVQEFQKEELFDLELLNKLSQEIRKNNVEAALRLIDKILVSPSSTFYVDLVFLSMARERKEIFHHFLQNSNMDINVLNKSGRSLLRQSLTCSDQYFLNEILEKGVSLDQNMYRMILHDAVEVNKPCFVECLLKYGAPMKNEDSVGMTPLDIAIENSNLEIVSMFLYYNCDTSAKYEEGNVSPFTYSMISDSNAEIQLLLLEYETDINNSDSFLNNLFVSIEKCQYLIVPILNHGANVNRICNDKNIIEWILDHPIESNNFRMIWDLFEYETWESTIDESILIAILNHSTVPNSLWNEYLRIIIESSKLQQILDYEILSLVSLFVEEYTKRGFAESDFYDLICILLENGCTVYAINVHKVYNILGGSSRILKLLVHMDVTRARLNIDFNFIRVRYSFDIPVNQLLRNFLFNMKVFNMTSSYKDILRYFTVPPKVKDYLQNHKWATCPFQITWDHVVPTLVELSRNKARDFICTKYNVKTGSLYYSIVNHCVLPKVIKDILTFEKPLYVHD